MSLKISKNKSFALVSINFFWHIQIILWKKFERKFQIFCQFYFWRFYFFFSLEYSQIYPKVFSSESEPKKCYSKKCTFFCFKEKLRPPNWFSLLFFLLIKNNLILFLSKCLKWLETVSYIFQMILGKNLFYFFKVQFYFGWSLNLFFVSWF